MDPVTTRLAAEVSERWQALDPLLPPAGPLPPGCGAALGIPGGDGLAAVASCGHWEGEPDALDLAWGAARRFELAVHIAGPDVPAGLAELLSQWRDHLSAVPAAHDGDSAAVVTWPSRDVQGAATLLRRGFIPLAVIAARSTPVESAGNAGLDGVRIRRAGPDDLDAATRLGLEVIRFDAHFGGVAERSSTPAALRRELRGLLARPQPWVWLAERGGGGDRTAIGMLAAETPDQAGWIAPLSGPAPAAYLLLMGVERGSRGGGVGAALAAHLHRQVQDAAVAVTLLHYALLNPLSMPFWSQQGYRPLWTSWEARPAAAIR
jgi:GNAT superfamily N-acetyltransferase